MSASGHAEQSWSDGNHQQMVAALERVRSALEAHVSGDEPAASEPAPVAGTTAAGESLALDFLSQTFGLSPFERDLLVLCAGCELDGTIGPLCASASSRDDRHYPTFSLALAALPGLHWSALSPGGPLRYWRLLEVGPGVALTVSPLRIDERILHFLVGVQYRDERLAGLVEPVPVTGELVPSHRELGERMARVWTTAAGRPDFPIVQLCGDETAGKWAVAAHACELLDRQLVRMPGDALPTAASELDQLVRLWRRESILSRDVLILDCDELEPSDAAREGALQRFVSALRVPLIVSSRQRRRPRDRPLLSIEVRRPTPAEQGDLWTELTKTRGGDPVWVEGIVNQFDLSTPTIRAAFAGALGDEDADAGVRSSGFGEAVWETCRAQARPALESLAERIVPKAGWDDLILPAAQLSCLHEIAAQVRHRTQVYQRWGFAAAGSRGLGIAAMFAGVSGTGKTLAAEILARELELDLFRIDLSGIISKYIGETEKNLKRVFDAAEEGGAILLFDEADAIFGKRSEVKDSHDRYANIEVSYLLQRMESYRGLAVLTTNQKEALDPAFVRRLRFIVVFPFPNRDDRARIWQRLLPPEMPTEGLRLERLAQLNLAGGNLRCVAINAAFLAAAAEEPVRMEHLLQASKNEYAKLERALSDMEIQGWIQDGPAESAETASEASR